MCGRGSSRPHTLRLGATAWIGAGAGLDPAPSRSDIGRVIHCAGGGRKSRPYRALDTRYFFTTRARITAVTAVVATPAPISAHSHGLFSPSTRLFPAAPRYT